MRTDSPEFKALKFRFWHYASGETPETFLKDGFELIACDVTHTNFYSLVNGAYEFIIACTADDDPLRIAIRKNDVFIV